MSMSKTRLEAFSDGVFAIVITLMILEIRLPQVDYAHLKEALISVLPNIIAYTMSFAVIGVYWLGHHQSFMLIHKIDGSLLWLNVLLLFFVSLIPFPTMLLGRYPNTYLPILLYGLNLIAANMMGLTMLAYLKHHPELGYEKHVRKQVHLNLPVYAIVNGSYIIAIIAGYWFPYVSYAIYFIILVLLISYYGKFNIGTILQPADEQNS